jgi:hypothetical protein
MGVVWVLCGLYGFEWLCMSLREGGVIWERCVCVVCVGGTRSVIPWVYDGIWWYMSGSIVHVGGVFIAKGVGI